MKRILIFSVILLCLTLTACNGAKTQSPTLSEEPSAASSEAVAEEDQTPLDRLAGSVEYDSVTGELRFTIPDDLGERRTLFLSVAGLLNTKEESGVTWYAFEEETENNSWVPGKTYMTAVRPDDLEFISIYAALLDADDNAVEEISVDVDPGGGVQTFKG